MKFNLTEPMYNKHVRWFFIKLAILASGWFICYHIILKPERIIDRPLTNFLTASASKVVNVIIPSSQLSWKQSPEKACSYIVHDGKQVMGIWDVCNGIDLMFIYAGIVLLLPYPVKRKLLFTFCGIVVIIVANIIRISSLYLIYIYNRSAFDFSHHYVFTILMYILIFYGWLLYTKKDSLNKNELVNG